MRQNRNEFSFLWFLLVISYYLTYLASEVFARDDTFSFTDGNYTEHMELHFKSGKHFWPNEDDLKNRCNLEISKDTFTSQEELSGCMDKYQYPLWTLRMEVPYSKVANCTIEYLRSVCEQSKKSEKALGLILLGLLLTVGMVGLVFFCRYQLRSGALGRIKISGNDSIWNNMYVKFSKWFSKEREVDVLLPSSSVEMTK